MLNDPLAAALAKILNAERVGKREVLIKPASKMIKKILTIMNDHRYIGAFEETDDGKGGVLKINLLGNINKCGVVKPRFSTKKNGFEKWEKRYLPAKDFGLLLVSTPKGLLTHNEAKTKETGGKLLAYCY
ncbi:30S ribosomal protein S8 [Candidatus Woesearchaeota archaeon]|jgi:small subunit ribosomal protein S8|nr:30S ribosomal protein S8 [Candidatus Woesearchaeota archaeon]MBT4151167.1 30S ribosomal protein S8 [Candidatus Woesearchaeota archaeon]MBT4247599.1 30S ribosomal protein S8 [Candidatus Woesearchaeota archaeon]MBT4433955.1 30S ribosomal protein S8 [Candidatus Woesearchaeota archaeon]MBT7331650.1 30S ribosomal protein S8 [Candidatus Woesearchaeota archaeon]